MKISKNIIMIAITIGIVLYNTVPVLANTSFNQKSLGVIKFDNGTPDDSSDDVIFDSSDFQKLYNVCK